jgi:transposase
MDLQEEVKAHTRRVEAGERVRYGQACPHCGVATDDFFRMHDCRRRKFRLVVERYIHVALSWILRWRCLRCGKRFSDYPPFRLATEAIRQAAGAGQGQGVPGNRSLLR